MTDFEYSNCISFLLGDRCYELEYDSVDRIYKIKNRSKSSRNLLGGLEVMA